MKRMAGQYFHGFEPGEAEYRLKKVRLCAGPPAIHELREVVALPWEQGLYDSAGRRLGVTAPVALSADGPSHFRDKLELQTPAVIDVPSQLQAVEETVIFGGFFNAHFGHFLIDSMARLWARDRFPMHPILVLRDGGTPAYQSDILSALGVTNRILSIKEPTLFRHVICPGSAIEYRWKIFEIADEPHVAAARTLQGTRSWSRPVYLTRSGLSDQQKIPSGEIRPMRKHEAEPELEAELSRRGFEVIRPEYLPLSDQISMFERAPTVVGTNSSAFHTALFCRSPRTSLSILNWGRGLENFLLTDAIKPHRCHYVKSIERYGSDGGEHVLDVGLTLRLLEEAGLIPSRTGVGYGA